MSKARSASDLLAKFQGGINWKLLEKGVCIEVDLSVFKNMPFYDPEFISTKITVGADKVLLQKVGESVDKIKLVVKFSK